MSSGTSKAADTVPLTMGARVATLPPAALAEMRGSLLLPREHVAASAGTAPAAHAPYRLDLHS